ncbi:glycine cleavage system protein H [Ferrimicrobium sp.]
MKLGGYDVAKVKCKGYEIRDDLYYDHDRNLWVERIASNSVRVGFDPLGVEVSGTLAQLVVHPNLGTLCRGDAVGTLEAEKFVGPLETPLGGRVVAFNEAVISDPRRIYADCFQAWLFELAGVQSEELATLVHPTDVTKDFEERVETYKRAGVLSW